MRLQAYTETEQSAFNLLSAALRLCERQMGQLPSRLVVHKSSRYWPDEMNGFKRAATGLRNTDFVAFGTRGIHFLRKGSYTALRGTAIQLVDDNHLLYTRRFVPFYDTYPGLRIPQPLEILEHTGDSGSDSGTICREILGLTKMNWNNTDFSIREPIALQFLREVGKIMAHVQEEVIPRPQYFYYM